MEQESKLNNTRDVDSKGGVHPTLQRGLQSSSVHRKGKSPARVDPPEFRSKAQQPHKFITKAEADSSHSLKHLSSTSTSHTQDTVKVTGATAKVTPHHSHRHQESHEDVSETTPDPPPKSKDRHKSNSALPASALASVSGSLVGAAIRTKALHSSKNTSSVANKGASNGGGGGGSRRFAKTKAAVVSGQQPEANSNSKKRSRNNDGSVGLEGTSSGGVSHSQKKPNMAMMSHMYPLLSSKSTSLARRAQVRSVKEGTASERKVTIPLPEETSCVCVGIASKCQRNAILQSCESDEGYDNDDATSENHSYCSAMTSEDDDESV